MKKLLSIIGAIGLGASAPAPLLANVPTPQQSEEIKTETITKDSVEYKKQKIDITINQPPQIMVDRKDNVYINTRNDLYKLSAGSTKPTKIKGINGKIIFISVDSKNSVIIELNNDVYYKLLAGSDTAEINNSGIEGDIFISRQDSKGNLYEIIDNEFYRLINLNQPVPPTPSNKLSTIAVAGIALGSVAGVAFVVLGSCYLYQYLNKKKKASKK